MRTSAAIAEGASQPRRYTSSASGTSLWISASIEVVGLDIIGRTSLRGPSKYTVNRTGKRRRERPRTKWKRIAQSDSFTRQKCRDFVTATGFNG